MTDYSFLTDEEIAASDIALVLDSNGGANYQDGAWEDFYTWEFLMNDCGDFDWLSFEYLKEGEH